jgi:hypothetical protein
MLVAAVPLLCALPISGINVANKIKIKINKCIFIAAPSLN